MLITSADNLRMDALLDSLVLFTKLYHKPFSAEALSAGLPIEPGVESPEQKKVLIETKEITSQVISQDMDKELAFLLNDNNHQDISPISQNHQRF